MRLRKLGKNCCPGNLGSASSIASLTEGGGGVALSSGAWGRAAGGCGLKLIR